VTLAFAATWLTLYLIIPREYWNPKKPYTFKVCVHYNPNLFVDDANEILVTVMNPTTKTITFTEVILVYSEDLPIAIQSDGSTALEFGDLKSGERKTKRLQVMATQDNASWLAQYKGHNLLNFEVRASGDGKPLESIGRFDIRVQGFFRAKRLLYTILAGLGPMIVWLGKEAWDYWFPKSTD
jgi:hypothetical protein